MKMPIAQTESNTIVYDMDGTLIHGDCGAAFIRQRINSSVWRLLLAVLIAPIAFPMMSIAPLRKLGVSAYLWIASVGVHEEDYAKILTEFIASYRIRPLENVLADCRRDIAEGRQVVIATGAGHEMTSAFMRHLGLHEHVHLVTSRSKRFFGGMVSAVQCNGERKLQELIKHGFPPPYLRVYSDTASDLPILRSAISAYLVNYREKDRRFLSKQLGDKLQSIAYKTY